MSDPKPGDTVTIEHASGSRITSRLQGTGAYVYAGEFCIAPLEKMLRKGWKLVDASPEERVATQYEVDRHAEKNCDGSYADAWRYFEKEGYDMSAVDPQYSRLED